MMTFVKFRNYSTQADMYVCRDRDIVVFEDEVPSQMNPDVPITKTMLIINGRGMVCDEGIGVVLDKLKGEH